MLAGSDKMLSGELYQLVDKKWVNMLPRYYPKTVRLKRYDHVNWFLNAALIPSRHTAHMFATKKEGFYRRSRVWNAASMMQMFRSDIFHGKEAVNSGWKNGKKMRPQDIRDVYFMRSRAELMGAVLKVLDRFSDPM